MSKTMYKSGLALIAILFAASTFAATPEEIIDAYHKDPALTLEQYGGQEMEFSGAVISRERAFGRGSSLWIIRINAGDFDVVGYANDEILVGQNVTLRGTCIGFREDWIDHDNSRIAVVLDEATVTDILQGKESDNNESVE